MTASEIIYIGCLVLGLTCAISLVVFHGLRFRDSATGHGAAIDVTGHDSYPPASRFALTYYPQLISLAIAVLMIAFAVSGMISSRNPMTPDMLLKKLQTAISAKDRRISATAQPAQLQAKQQITSTSPQTGASRLSANAGAMKNDFISKKHEAPDRKPSDAPMTSTGSGWIFSIQSSPTSQSGQETEFKTGNVITADHQTSVLDEKNYVIETDNLPGYGNRQQVVKVADVRGAPAEEELIIDLRDSNAQRQQMALDAGVSQTAEAVDVANTPVMVGKVSIFEALKQGLFKIKASMPTQEEMLKHDCPCDTVKTWIAKNP